ncbi:MAG: aspartyl-phosphate phosphatase Spo0E family protein [Tumebacillaceae bacterium]
MNCISGQIETLRKKLLETVDRYSGNFLHPHVQRLSQELDLLIVRVQQARMEDRRLTETLNKQVQI